MYVIKRSGQRAIMQPEKIMQKLQSLSYGLSPMVDIEAIYEDVKRGLYDGVKTTDIDGFIAEQAAGAATKHPDYSLLAGRILANSLQTAKSTPKNFVEAMRILYKAGLIEDDFMMSVAVHGDALNKMVVAQRDYNFDYFGFKTLERSYLMRTEDGTIQETPQFLYMRVACALHLPNLEKVQTTYNMLSEGLATHATPTLFNAGTRNPQMASCFLLPAQSDSIEGIYDTLKQTAEISKWAGGIGASVSNIRAKGSYINGTGGKSNGIVPMLQVFNMTARYVDQGGNKRKGSFAIYLEPHHPDILDFLDLKKNHGKEELRARDLFYGLWVSDLFMKRVDEDGVWSLFCPSQCPELQDAYGEDYEKLYLDYEDAGAYSRQIKARELWDAILTAQIETGMPYMLYKDHANSKSNQKNLGTIRSSNLCTEIIQYSSKDEVAVCNLLSIALPKFVNKSMTYGFDFAKLREVVHIAVENCNIVIDKNKYPVPQAQNSNIKHRPIGLGVQGLADTFALLGYAFDSKEAKQLNSLIFEAIYLYALEASAMQAKKFGAYSSYAGSPASDGILQPDMWGVDTNPYFFDKWQQVRDMIAANGLRNSLLVAPMPTASTSQILGNTECFEPFTSNMYTRRTLSGEFIITNKHLVRDLEARGLWNEAVRKAIIANDGSVQNISAIPAELREVYKTAYEIKQRDIVDMAADRGAFIDQSQSLNIFMAHPTHAKLTAMHFHGWRKGLKTGMYYLRSQAAAAPIKFTLEKEDEPKVCSIDNPDCEACSS